MLRRLAAIAACVIFLAAVPTGSLYVTTLPSGADVWIDGTYAGRSPLVLGGLVAGRHTVGLTKTGWDPLQLEVSVVCAVTTLTSSCSGSQPVLVRPTVWRPATKPPSTSGLRPAASRVDRDSRRSVRVDVHRRLRRAALEGRNVPRRGRPARGERSDGARPDHANRAGLAADADRRRAAAGGRSRPAERRGACGGLSAGRCDPHRRRAHRDPLRRPRGDRAARRDLLPGRRKTDRLRGAADDDRRAPLPSAGAAHVVVLGIPLMAQIYIETHGCQMNEADSHDIQRRAISAGFTLAQRPEDASVLVLNTCTVRDNAERRAYGRISHWKAVKDADPSVKVIVTGCLAEQDKDRMRKIVPHVDGVFGTRELGALGDALAAWRAEYPDDQFSVDRGIETVMGGEGVGIAGPYDFLRAYVNVQRGCSYYCTFCIVPHVRGRFDHRPM